jgi:HD-like signal output (HDOD) protein
MTLWNIPDPIVEAIACHHNPAASTHTGNPVLTAVYVAELLASQGNDATAPDYDLAYLEMLGLSDRLLEWQQLCSNVFTH